MSKKANFSKMLELFDKTWKDNRGRAWTGIQEWKIICEDNSWTDEEFDKQLDDYLEDIAAKNAA